VSGLMIAALKYSSLGWPVLPTFSISRSDGEFHCDCHLGKDCPSAGKHPRLIKGVKGATVEESKIRNWWNIWPQANVAVATGDIVCLDVDPRNGGDASLRRLFQKVPTIRTRSHVVASGTGVHLYFKKPDVKWRPSHLLSEQKGIDVRAKGHYCIAAPSLHISGRRYQVVKDRSSDLQPLPRSLWIPAQSKKSRTSDAPMEFNDALLLKILNVELTRSERRIKTAVRGDRNNRLNLECFLWGGRSSHHQLDIKNLVQHRLSAAAKKAGLSKSEIELTFNSGWTAGHSHPTNLAGLPNGNKSL